MTMVDRISKLPDEVLCHILSFLPTEEAVTTILLSKRWRPLWPSLSTLDFDDFRFFRRRRDLQGKEKQNSDPSFINFVYAAILSRDLHQPIKNFRLIWGESESLGSHVKVWLNAAIQQRQVQNIKIRSCVSQVPCSILKCTTLVVLKLSSVVFDDFSTVDLPSLKTLHLKSVLIEKLQSFVELLYGCPILENLKARDVSFYDYELEGRVKSLPKLVRAEVLVFFQGYYIPVKAFSNVQFLLLDECDADIPVFPNLIYLELLFGGSIKFSLALDMLNRCSKLQTVVFNLDGRDDVWPYPCSVPECFSSHLTKCILENFDAVECHMRFARCLVLCFCALGLSSRAIYYFLEEPTRRHITFS
ncbi:F-box protein At4g09920-like isoform X2 [Lotus japonicus]|uniref:F-box protein At4g09920-like isoform X2 n=1 Tax=Lotus japonicus TaxID=34305 RepID=UPI00258A4509|nr:F-box protein At4g09920-like isoform X2 [Lotus japonicus]